jgi:hypothetical protein
MFQEDESAAPLGILSFVQPELERKKKELFSGKTSRQLVLAKQMFVFSFFVFSFGEESLFCYSKI